MKPKWHKKLNKRLLAHIKETTTSGLLWQVKENIDHQRNPSTNQCFDCDEIARRLGLK